MHREGTCVRQLGFRVARPPRPRAARAQRSRAQPVVFSGNVSDRRGVRRRELKCDANRSSRRISSLPVRQTTSSGRSANTSHSSSASFAGGTTYRTLTRNGPNSRPSTSSAVAGSHSPSPRSTSARAPFSSAFGGGGEGSRAGAGAGSEHLAVAAAAGVAGGAGSAGSAAAARRIDATCAEVSRGARGAGAASAPAAVAVASSASSSRSRAMRSSCDRSHTSGHSLPVSRALGAYGDGVGGAGDEEHAAGGRVFPSRPRRATTRPVARQPRPRRAGAACPASRARPCVGAGSRCQRGRRRPARRCPGRCRLPSARTRRRRRRDLRDLTKPRCAPARPPGCYPATTRPRRGMARASGAADAPSRAAEEIRCPRATRARDMTRRSGLSFKVPSGDRKSREPPHLRASALDSCAVSRHPPVVSAAVLAARSRATPAPPPRCRPRS